MKCTKFMVGMLMAATLVACGGGGGSPDVPEASVGSNSGGNVTTPTGTDTSPAAATSTLALDVMGGGGTSTTSISTAEIAQVKAVLKDVKGAAVKGAIVTFSETGASLLTFSPTAKTALTDDAGVAVVEVRASSSSSTGATLLSATATVAGTAITGQKAISISGAPSSGVVDPQVLANALNFLDVNPADRSIVIAGSGGNGRSESATLRFRVVDTNNSPVKGATVSFSLISGSGVKLNIPNALSDSDGVVVSSVSSGNVATAVVVRASVDGRSIASQSDQLTVTTGLVTQSGFDMSAGKYNMNYRLTGDSTTITVRIVDANGNPVADGIPVVFTADYGAVGSSSRGGCVTLNGRCTVEYAVQNPRSADGMQAQVIASTRLGDGTLISDSLRFNMSDLFLVDLYTTPDSTGKLVKSLPLNGCAPQTISLYAGTPAAIPAPANTAISVQPITTDLVATLTNGSPILDQLASPAFRTNIDFKVDVSAISGTEACVATGNRRVGAVLEVKFTAGEVTQSRRLEVTYLAL